MAGVASLMDGMRLWGCARDSGHVGMGEGHLKSTRQHSTGDSMGMGHLKRAISRLWAQDGAGGGRWCRVGDSAGEGHLKSSILRWWG